MSLTLRSPQDSVACQPLTLYSVIDFTGFGPPVLSFLFRHTTGSSAVDLYCGFPYFVVFCPLTLHDKGIDPSDFCRHTRVCWSRGPMARRLTTNQEIAGSIPAAIILLEIFWKMEGLNWCYRDGKQTALSSFLFAPVKPRFYHKTSDAVTSPRGPLTVVDGDCWLGFQDQFFYHSCTQNGILYPYEVAVLGFCL
ncbi:hypothetical protein L873DRAFT_1034790 [Choiromyces venosus 120613-1]|uniref:Uncharacterized protein n=1 Tax=Choiromyces venosus 120613-1 TaxID=1336337 RepID=A0A3N4JJZ6_9PEZI|nr:hypothetical protein L873DRAFT_1034790 [Choiromyces venosus 120613-1]